MDYFRFMEVVFLFLSFALLTSQMVAEDIDYVCPLIDISTYDKGKTTHNITRSVKCENGRRMAGCCVDRFYCDFNTSHIDLSMYGPPGFRMSCGNDVCCPQKYILPIPLSNNTKGDNNDSSMSASDNSGDEHDDD